MQFKSQELHALSLSLLERKLLSAEGGLSFLHIPPPQLQPGYLLLTRGPGTYIDEALPLPSRQVSAIFTHDLGCIRPGIRDEGGKLRCFSWLSPGFMSGIVFLYQLYLVLLEVVTPVPSGVPAHPCHTGGEPCITYSAKRATRAMRRGSNSHRSIFVFCFFSSCSRVLVLHSERRPGCQKMLAAFLSFTVFELGLRLCLWDDSLHFCRG